MGRARHHRSAASGRWCDSDAMLADCMPVHDSVARAIDSESPPLVRRGSYDPGPTCAPVVQSSPVPSKWSEVYLESRPVFETLVVTRALIAW